MNSEIELYAETSHGAANLRELASVCFRHQRLILFTLCIVIATFILYVCVVPRTYQAETEILVKRGRADPVVTPDNNASPVLTTDLSEEDLNSEVEILRSRDLLERVVMSCGLDHEPPHSVMSSFIRTVISSVMQRFAISRPERAVALAVRRLDKKLKVEAIRKTNLVRVTYDSPDPQLAASVLRTLTNSVS